ncbi:protein SLOW GREEN 1, chloroplastic [Rosa sericea]
MESLAKLNHRHQPLHLSINPHRPSCPNPISSFRPPPRSSSPLNFSSLKIRASSSSADPPHQTPRNPIPSFLQTLSPLACAAIAAAAFFTMRFHPTKPAVAAPIAPATVEPGEETAGKLPYEDAERQIEEQLSRDPNDVEALRSLMEVKIKAHKLTEAVQVLDRLIEIEPEDYEWQLLKANVHTYLGENDLAASEFEDILAKDPLRVEAYHGLVMSASQSEEKLKLVLKRVEKAMEGCKKQGNTSDVRDFKLLIAQIRVMEAEYKDALELYQELVREEPRDFRPYLCQGIIYTLLRKKNEAEKQFATFRKLVPKNHPYKEYFDDNMFATKLFGAKVDRETAGSNM